MAANNNILNPTVGPTLDCLTVKSLIDVCITPTTTKETIMALGSCANCPYSTED